MSKIALLIKFAPFLASIAPKLWQKLHKQNIDGIRNKYKMARKGAGFFYRLGHRTGVSRGRKEGKLAERQEIAARLKDAGVDAKIIRKTTRLSR